jgi:hypothetical protein
MEIIVCIDDTDNLESAGTGKLAAALIDDIRHFGWGGCGFITRHQLFVHPDVPYTSHNSAMCFTADIAKDAVDRLIGHAADFLAINSAQGSDPGLCVADINGVNGIEELVAFGMAAKSRVLDKDESYALARRTGVHLSEHGGTGQGVIGALAGVGLRLSGNDGRLRGRLELGMPNSILRVRQVLMSKMVERVITLDGRVPGLNDEVVLGEKVKALFMDGGPVLPVVECKGGNGGACWRTCTKEELRGF